jgi:hypothetical protein
MKIEHVAGGKRTIASEGDVHILQTNRTGGFAALAPKPTSRYEGVFFRKGNDVFKVIERLELPGTVTSVTNRVSSVSRAYDHGLVETFCMPDGQDALIYSLDKRSEVSLVLDCRQLYDSKQWGRTYTLSVDHKCLVVSFQKKNDARETNGQEYDLHLAVFGEGMEFLPVQQWNENYYDADQRRNSFPWSRWVFTACKMRVKDAVFAFATDKNKAVETAINVYAQRAKFIDAKQQRIKQLLSENKLKNPDLNVSRALAVGALDALHCGDGKSYAGIPWFTQAWTRDELISIGANIVLGDFVHAKHVLGRYLSEAKGAVLPRFSGSPMGAPDAHVPAADGMGWLFFRMGQFMDALERARKLKTFLKSSELDTAEDKLDTALNGLFKERSKDGLIINNPDETWMDTSFNGDSRAGARIEIQALTLAMLQLHARLTGTPDPREKELRDAVRKHFWTGKTIKDGKEDPTIRPNCFLAAFLYPQLFDKKDWMRAFDAMLPKLWLDWGGLASIATDHPLFTANSSGENVRSYHRGDSWFWVNNIAAIVLHRLDKKKYSDYIRTILKASMHEQEALGISGASGELSSASTLRSEGCWSQLWSSATLIELLHELENK